MRIILAFISAFILFTGAAHAVTIDFSSFSPGDSIEGLGTVHPLLNISTGNGGGVALFPGLTPASYGAPNNGGSILNGGISPNGGFADLETARLHDFEFSLAPGVTLDAFSIRMVDYGDFNPAHATEHNVTFEALDAQSTIVDSATLFFTSAADTNPRSGSAGDLFLTGDAVTALAGQPGLFTFSVVGTGITTVRVRYTHNGSDRPFDAPSDTNIAFDSLDIDFAQVPEPGTFMLLLAALTAYGRARHRARR